MPGYFDVTLGLELGNGSSGIVIRGTCSRFVLGNKYVISITETLEIP